MVFVGDEVVGFAPVVGGGAPGEHAAAVAFAERFALAGGGVAEHVGDAEDLDGAVFEQLLEEVGGAAAAQEPFGGGAGDGGAVVELAAPGREVLEVLDRCAVEGPGVDVDRDRRAGVAVAGAGEGAAHDEFVVALRTALGERRGRRRSSRCPAGTGGRSPRRSRRSSSAPDTGSSERSPTHRPSSVRDRNSVFSSAGIRRRTPSGCSGSSPRSRASASRGGFGGGQPLGEEDLGVGHGQPGHLVDQPRLLRREQIRELLERARAASVAFAVPITPDRYAASTSGHDRSSRAVANIAAARVGRHLRAGPDPRPRRPRPVTGPHRLGVEHAHPPQQLRLEPPDQHRSAAAPADGPSHPGHRPGPAPGHRRDPAADRTARPAVRQRSHEVAGSCTQSTRTPVRSITMSDKTPKQPEMSEFGLVRTAATAAVRSRCRPRHPRWCLARCGERLGRVGGRGPRRSCGRGRVATGDRHEERDPVRHGVRPDVRPRRAPGCGCRRRSRGR